MRLWTIQNYAAYEVFLKKGVLLANEDHLFCEDDFLFAYDWIAEEMKAKGIMPPSGVNYPVWAWYQWEGKRKRRDMREGGHAERGTKIVQLTIDVPDEDVLLSDFDLFHYVLNYWYLAVDEADDEAFERTYTAQGFKFLDLSDFTIQTPEMRRLRATIVQSWERVFQLDHEDDNYIYGKNTDKSIQATFWQLKPEQVVKAEIFVAK